MADGRMQWRRSTRCESASCLEVANDGTTVRMRNSTHPDGPELSFTTDEWVTFLNGLKNDRFRRD
jgi:hypothetical protein